MRWLWHDPDRDEMTPWWTIDPATGHPDRETAVDSGNLCCLGESVLDSVAEAADAIATEFAMQSFTDREIESLLSGRGSPSSFRGGPDDAAELAELVYNLWAVAEDCYQQALKRLPNPIERRWLLDQAIATLRARVDGRTEL